MNDFCGIFTLLRNSANLKRKCFFSAIILAAVLILAAAGLKMDHFVEKSASNSFILFVWCVRMVPVNELYVYTASSLFLTSPKRKKFLTRTMVMFNSILNFAAFFLLAAYYLFLYAAGKTDEKHLFVCIIYIALSGVLLNIYLPLYYKKIWLSFALLFLFVGVETFFFEYFSAVSDYFEAAARKVPVYGMVLLGAGVMEAVNLLSRAYAFLNYRSAMDERAVRQLKKSEKF